MTTTRRVTTPDGVELSVTDAGDGPVVLLVHGFPELAHSWRHQVAALADAGYRVLAPDMRGYGASDRPEVVTDYDIDHLTGDLVALLDDVGATQAVVVGHDWGSIVAWNFALLHPERTAGVVGMSVPFVPRPPAPPISIMRQLFADNFFYMVYFQEPGVADADLGRDAARTMRNLLCARATPDAPPDPTTFANDGRGFVDRIPEAGGLPSWLTEDELRVYTDTFTRTGFTGGINWYRNLDRNWELTAAVADIRAARPDALIVELGWPDPSAKVRPDVITYCGGRGTMLALLRALAERRR